VNEYRSRIYSAYVTGRHRPLAPATLQGLAPRESHLNRLIRLHFPDDKEARILYCA
jgi:hypothetical protein